MATEGTQQLVGADQACGGDGGEVLNREYVVKMYDTAWERLWSIMAMAAMYIEGFRATTNSNNKSDRNNNIIDY